MSSMKQGVAAHFLYSSFFKDHPRRQAIDAERHRLFMVNSFKHLLIGNLTGFIVLVMFWQFADGQSKLIWFVLNCVLTLVTSVFYAIFYRNDSRLSLHQWCISTFGVSVLWGVVWGACSHLLFQTSDVFYSVCLMVIILSMAMTPAPAMIYYPWAYFAFATCLCIGAALQFYAVYDSGYALALTAFFLLSLYGYGWDLHKTMIEKIILVLDNEDAYQQASAANKVKTRFLATASHDLRQPLQAMHLFMESLQHEVHSDKGQKDFVALRTSLISVSALLDKMLDVSDIENQTIRAHFEHIPVSACLTKLVNEYAILAANKGLSFTSSIDDSVVFSDGLLLGRVVSNVLSNALRYTISGGVALTAQQEAESVVIRISDTGIGISPQEQQRIFDEFFVSEHQAPRVSDKRMGMGLYIVKELTDLLGIRLSLESELGQGTCFTLHVPRGQLQTQAISPQPETTHFQLLQDYEVLLIEDDVAVREGLESLLRTWGCQVQALASMNEVQALFTREDYQPHCIISDYTLVDSANGVAIIHWVREHLNQPIPAVLISGDFNLKNINLTSIDEADVTMCAKPVRPAKLRAILHRLAQRVVTA